MITATYIHQDESGSHYYLLVYPHQKYTLTHPPLPVGLALPLDIQTNQNFDVIEKAVTKAKPRTSHSYPVYSESYSQSLATLQPRHMISTFILTSTGVFVYPIRNEATNAVFFIISLTSSARGHRELLSMISDSADYMFYHNLTKFRIRSFPKLLKKNIKNPHPRLYRRQVIVLD